MSSNHTTTDAGDKREPLACVVYVRPRCPVCNSVRIGCRKTKPQGDGSVLRSGICRECGEHFNVIAE